MKHYGKPYSPAPFLQGQKFKDAKGRVFTVLGVWYKMGWPFSVEFQQEGEEQKIEQLVLDLKILFDKGLLIHWDV